jgi:hypothetical protein
MPQDPIAAVAGVPGCGKQACARQSERAGADPADHAAALSDRSEERRGIGRCALGPAVGADHHHGVQILIFSGVQAPLRPQPEAAHGNELIVRAERYRAAAEQLDRKA